METVSNIVSAVDSFVWGPVMLVLLMGTGIFLTIRIGFRSWLNLPYALKSVLSREARTTERGTGDISPFAALMTALAATIGTGNIVGVATALVSGGPGALVWMELSAIFGLTSKFSECMLAIKYRTVNEQGEMLGGPMTTMKRGFRNKTAGAVLAMLFAIFAVVASFGIGNMTQANSIASALQSTFSVPAWVTGAVITVSVLVILLGGITRLSKVSSVIVPVMAVFYLVFGIIVILGNFAEIPAAIALMFRCAFSTDAVTGGVLGTIVSGMMNSMRYGVARGVFSNEAGMGSAAITAAAATTDDPVRQGYINMTGTFFDTIVICTVTGLAVCSSGVLGTIDPATGELLTGSALTIAAFETVLGTFGGWIVTIGIVLFAFSTILGWEYHGEKALEYIVKKPSICMAYRVLFSLIAFVGATTSLDLVWNLSDIANALMAIPNLISLLALSGVIAKEVKRFQPTIEAERAAKKASRAVAQHAK
ncbi:MAG TPA: sodium:alanine symporter family protein [Candidatus Butyricicoccus stercorigallinarum]|nr:sodium:alanine symporter family protein [Candidatus Butyricicoccus stercorigallinarum]